MKPNMSLTRGITLATGRVISLVERERERERESSCHSERERERDDTSGRLSDGHHRSACIRGRRPCPDFSPGPLRTLHCRPPVITSD